MNPPHVVRPLSTRSGHLAVLRVAFARHPVEQSKDLFVQMQENMPAGALMFTGSPVSRPGVGNSGGPSRLASPP